MNPTARKSVLAIMSSQLKQYTADHRYLLEVVTQQTGLAEPVAVELDEFYVPLLKAARKGPLLPIDGVLVRDWDPDNRRIAPGFQLGIRLYDLEGIRFVRVRCGHGNQSNIWGLDFIAVDRKDYRRLYKIALRCRRDSEPPSNAPVLPAEQLDLLWKNTIGYLEAPNLNRIKAYGGRARRGVLLTGAPGNGKTMACRWLWEACRQRRWDYRLVTPDNYRQARAHDTIEELFSVDRRGIVFFDDMDLALRDRETVHETEDQAVFLSALDGINVHEGVVFVFTTNCSLDLIDRAFKRPGRIDLVLNFKPPDERLRRQLIERWHEDILGHINVDLAVASTEGFSFAEIEELKNLLVMRCMDSGDWDWDWALKQFDVNRSELGSRPRRHVGFVNRRNNGDEIPF
ncbi:MAG: AAA family ATPase [Planctomycetes bacterium]|nr:AAA family ATPase [Planctomycetota bacterium]